MSTSWPSVGARLFRRSSRGRYQLVLTFTTIGVKFDKCSRWTRERPINGLHLTEILLRTTEPRPPV